MCREINARFILEEGVGGGGIRSGGMWQIATGAILFLFICSEGVGESHLFVEPHLLLQQFFIYKRKLQ